MLLDKDFNIKEKFLNIPSYIITAQTHRMWTTLEHLNSDEESSTHTCFNIAKRR